MEQQKQHIDIEYQEEEEGGINFMEIFAALKRHSKLYKIVLPIALVISCIIAFSLPDYYSCEVRLAPELSTTRSSNSLSMLSSLYGLRIGNSMTGNSEALYPTLYPELVNSTDFKVSLFNIPVHKKDSTRIITYYDYLAKEQKRPWWGAALGGVVRFFASLLPAGEKQAVPDGIDPFQLTREQAAIVGAIGSKVLCDVDTRTLVISIIVNDQDPLICAMMADSVKERLQEFITDYRTQKARVDYQYSLQLEEEAKQRYDEARKAYADYADANQDIVLQSARTKLINLENEMQIKYNRYNSVAQSVMTAEAKVQEETPSFTILQRATVPTQKAGPGRKKIILVSLAIAFLLTSVWILYKEGQLKNLMGFS